MYFLYLKNWDAWLIGVCRAFEKIQYSYAQNSYVKKNLSLLIHLLHVSLQQLQLLTADPHLRKHRHTPPVYNFPDTNTEFRGTRHWPLPSKCDSMHVELEV